MDFFNILIFTMLSENPQFQLMIKTKNIPKNEVLSLFELLCFAKFSEKLTFLTPWYAHVRVLVRIRE